MKNFLELTETLAKMITDSENNRKKVGNFLRETNDLTDLQTDDDIRESKIINPIEPANLENLTIAGIDGGLVKKSFHGIDLMLLRAVGVIFRYKIGRASCRERV